MSTLFPPRMEDMAAIHTLLPQGTARHHCYCDRCHGHTQDYHRHRWTLLNACEHDTQSSDSHDTLRSIQMDSHSLRASLALNHVTWRSKQHREHHDRANFWRKDFRCTELLHTRCRKRIPHTGDHFCTCCILGCEGDKGTVIHHRNDCNALHQLSLKHEKGRYLTWSVFWGTKKAGNNLYWNYNFNISLNFERNFVGTCFSWFAFSKAVRRFFIRFQVLFVNTPLLWPNLMLFLFLLKGIAMSNKMLSRSINTRMSPSVTAKV